MTNQNPMPAIYDALGWPLRLRPTADDPVTSPACCRPECEVAAEVLAEVAAEFGVGFLSGFKAMSERWAAK